MRLAYLGTPDAAVQPLRALVEAGHDLRIVVTQSDKRRGRGNATSPSPVKQAATALGLHVSHRVADVIDADVELEVIVAFGRLIKADVLARVPMINVHFSLLPRWRGAAPVERAILAGDDTTGVCIMQLEEGLDTGPVYACEPVDIFPDDSAEALRGRLTDVGTRLLVDLLAAPLPPPEPQTGEPLYAAKITPDDVRIDWTRPADEVLRVVRVGPAWTTFRGKRLHIVRASRVDQGSRVPPGLLLGPHVGCGDDAQLELLEVKPEGRGVQSAAAWRNGARLEPGERLGS